LIKANGAYLNEPLTVEIRSREEKMSNVSRRSALYGFAAAAMLAVGLGPVDSARAQGDPIRIALGDIETVETLNFLIAVERAKERGVPIEMQFLKSEDIAAQAVVSGESDIGIGTPYALIQKSRAPIRMFFRMSSLRFFPVVNTDFYQDWDDLDGEEVVVHSRGSGTEALMRLMEQKHGIQYSNISYVPGSEVRAGAMLQGNVKATIVDSAAWRLIQDKGGDKFKVLPVDEVDATDEALYANTNFLEEREDDVAVLVEELLKTWREIAENPEVVVELKEKYNLAQDLPSDLEAELVPFYRESAESGVFPLNGGSPEQIQADFDFYATAGQLEGEPSELKVEDFWDFDPVNKALEKVGKV
jgi:NitT/TauT family transport system substrate-binding protein